MPVLNEVSNTSNNQSKFYPKNSTLYELSTDNKHEGGEHNLTSNAKNIKNRKKLKNKKHSKRTQQSNLVTNHNSSTNHSSTND